MFERHLLFAASSPDNAEMIELSVVLETGLDSLKVTLIENGLEVLTHLAQRPDFYQVLILDLPGPGLPESTLIQGIRDINPDLEIILLHPEGHIISKPIPTVSHRPILLTSPVDPQDLIASVSKLLELMELRQQHQYLNRGFKRHIALARKNMEAVLALLNRPVGVGMISMRRDGFITFCNPEARRLTGYSQDEVPHIRKWAENLLRDPARIQAVLTTFTRSWTVGAKREEINLRIRHKQGKAVNLSASTLILQDDKGEPRQLVILLFDPKNRATINVFQALLSQAPVGIYTYYAKEGFEQISPAAVDLINRAFSVRLHESDILGRLVHNLPLPPDQIELWQNTLEKALAGKAGVKTELPPLGLPGQRVLAHPAVLTFHYGDEGYTGVLAVVEGREDLRAEAYSHLTPNELCRLTLMNISDPFLLLKAVRSENGIIDHFLCLMANKAAVRILGLKQMPDSGPRLADLFYDRLVPEIIYQNALETVETGVGQDFELTLQLKDSGALKSVVHFWMGKVGDGIGLFFREVTAKRQEERVLRQYRHIFAHMDESIIVTDLVGNITDWNPASERMFGYAKEEILGQTALILTSNKKGTPLQEEAEKILREGDVWKGEYLFTRSNGHTGVASTVFALLKDDDGQPYGTVGLSRDVTESKRLEERLMSRTQELEEKNIALNTLLRHAEEERLRACQQVVGAVTSKFSQGLNQILGARYNPEMVDNLSRLLLQDLGRDQSSTQGDDGQSLARLSDKELEVARLIRLGKTTEEIAFILDKSPDTVRLQRISIRKKLGLNRRDKNLHKFLLGLEVF